jgi:hypothetical protein
MRIVRFSWPGWTCLLILLLAACAPGPEPVLPEAVAGWTAIRPPEVYVGDDLFAYINGGAEIYHEYGFDQVTVCDYGRDDSRITVEVYTMTGSAYGIYSYSRSARGSAIELGSGGTLADYYLTFWSGNQLVVVTAQSTDQGHEQVLAVAEALAERFPEAGSQPELMAELAQEHRLPGSEQYLRGRLAMRNLSPLVPGLFSGYREAAAARYQTDAGPSLQIVIAWQDEPAAVAAIAGAAGSAGSSQGVTVEVSGPDLVRLSFDRGETLEAVRDRSLTRLTITSHPKDTRAFHPTFEGDDLLHMEQCIADLNTVVRKPDLIIADAMTILTSKGPFGPGDIAHPNQVVAGIDRVAFDAYGATILGLKGTEVTMIRKAHEHGLGEIDLTKVKLQEIKLG